jgi:hypothetical protein
MKRTLILLWDDTVDSTRFAKWHHGDGSQYETYKNRTESGADDLVTTVEDYGKLMVHVLNGAGLSPRLYAEMISSQVRINDNKFWGLSWWIDENIAEGQNALVHGGDDKGVHTIAFLLPSTKQGLLIFTNCDNGTDVYIPIILSYLGKLGQGIIDIETR